EPFVSTEARILRFPHLLSSVYFEVFARNSFNFRHLTRFDLSSREVNNTAFKNAVNHLFTATGWPSAYQEKR
ncbi:hypothetical protein V0R39_26405, partial [Pseudomonas inefficax]|nr:hypothetical protein [Pseudomonas inefficax]MEE1910513.1 hypothetical protein [Pseudomonas inefficax]MEE1987987.1 hypothetical protein [Pseudomonas inefficax]